jgi:Polyketide cyclase / dehydrase and lipid transport
MRPIHVSAERLLPAPAAEVYALLADYRHGHPRILPPAFSDLTVLEGGVDAGTRIRYRLTLAGRAREITARIAEPAPGRVLTETDVDTGAVTTFTVDPAGDKSRLRIETTWQPNRVVVGLVARLLAPPLLRRLYAQELDLIEQWSKGGDRSLAD